MIRRISGKPRSGPPSRAVWMEVLCDARSDFTEIHENMLAFGPRYNMVINEFGLYVLPEACSELSTTTAVSISPEFLVKAWPRTFSLPAKTRVAMKTRMVPVALGEVRNYWF